MRGEALVVHCHLCGEPIQTWNRSSITSADQRDFVGPARSQTFYSRKGNPRERLVHIDCALRECCDSYPGQQHWDNCVLARR